jgi:cation-transporting ATPase E
VGVSGDEGVGVSDTAAAGIDPTAAPLTGLSAAEVAERVATGRTNAFEDATSRSAWSIIRANVFTLFNGIIISCFAVLLILGRWQDALFGLSAVANTIIGSVQEFRAKAALDKLALLHAPHARVLRDGEAREVPVSEVVIDDILLLEAGDQIAADGEVLDSQRLQVDESMLTGESDAVDKHAGDRRAHVTHAGAAHIRAQHARAPRARTQHAQTHVDRTHVEHPGTGRPPAERGRAEQPRAEQPSAERAGIEHAGTDQVRPGQPPADRAGTDQARPPHPRSEHAGDEQAGDEVLSGSIVVGGEGVVRVTRVGANSFANSLASEAKRFSLMSSELRRSVNIVLRFQAWIIGPVALLVANAQMSAFGGWEHAIASGGWRQAAVNAIAAIIAMIPLGLVLMTSIAFAVGAVKLAGQQVLVQELAAVEGLARVDVVCLDKTGTLTEGEIVYDATHLLDAAGEQPDASAGDTGPHPSGDVQVHAPAGWRDALAWYGAEPSANATARCLAAEYPAQHALEPVARIPFSSARKWSAVAFDDHAAGTWVLGAPEMVHGGPEHADLRSRAATLAASGRRTLVLAHCAAALTAEQAETEHLADDLRPVALLTFRETVRPDALQTLGYFASQGVQVKIISGDNPQTVAAIAREVGLDAPYGVDARELPEDPEALAPVLDEHTVFGRVSPTQKKAFVQALRARGHTVAMTGDGVNDALAIKEADIGIAMESGSAATKAVARIVLLDGRFSHLPGVVAEGRQVIANIERVSMLFLTKTAWATVLAIVFGISLMQFPFLPRQMSIVDGLTIGIPAFFLALMPNRRRYIPGFLRRSLSFAIPAGVVIGLLMWWYAWAANGVGVPAAELRTGATLILTIVSLWVLVVLSRPIDGWKIVIVGAMMVGLILAYSVPVARTFLGFASITLPDALLVLGVSVVAIAAVELVRFVHRRYVRRHGGDA